MKRLAEWCLLRVVPAWAVDGLLGDLEEEFARVRRTRGPAAATRWYVVQSIAIGVRYLVPARRRFPIPENGDRQGSRGRLRRPFLGLDGDIRLAVRRLTRTPIFSTTAVLTLAIGIGANTSLFALANAVLFKPLTNHEPDRVVRITAAAIDRPPSTQFAYREFRRLHASARLDDVAAVHLATIALRSPGRQDQLLGELASASYFRIRPARVVRGRPLQGPDDAAGAPPAAMVSARYWTRELAGDPEIVGRAVTINGRPFTIVGVAAADFAGSFIGAPVDVWLPLEQTLTFLGPGATEGSSVRALTLFARLPRGIGVEQARASLGMVERGIAELRGERAGIRLDLPPGQLLHGSQRGMAVALLAIIGALTVAVLVIAASNVANLLLGRALAQRSETATRLALGARVGRIVRQQLVESLLLASLGGAGGFLIAWWVAVTFGAVVLLPGFELRLDLAPDWRVVAVTFGLIASAAAVATLAPALAAARNDPASWLKDGRGSIGSPRAARIRSVLVVTQVAVASLVAVAACLLVKSGSAASRLDLGFRTEGTFATDVDLRTAGYTDARARTFYRLLEDKVAAVPGVRAVALANRAPLDSSTPGLRVADERTVGPSPGEGSMLEASYTLVSPAYFDTVAVRLVAGRVFERSSRAVVVNEALARRLWPAIEPLAALGARIQVAGLGGGPLIAGSVEVVGIARDAKYRTLGEARQPHVYLPVETFFAPDLTLLVHAPGGPPPAAAVQAAMASIDPAIQGFFTRTLDEHTRVSRAPARFAAAASGLAGAVAAVLAAVGLYGVIFCLVSERRREFGLCLALGASPAGLTWQVMTHGLRLTVAGAGIGLAGAAGVSPFLSGWLYGTSATDPLVYGSVVLATVAITLCACYFPARAAARIDPLVALR